MDWFERTLESHYELRKGGRLGPGKDDQKAGLILNRVIRWIERGIEYEADPRQAEKLLEKTGLEGANSVATPGVKPLPAQMEADKLLPVSEHTTFRALAARGNYLAQIDPIASLQPKRCAGGWRRPLN